MDGGAWWAAIYGVAQSRTRLKRLSSSSTPLLNINYEEIEEHQPELAQRYSNEGFVVFFFFN